MALGNLAQRFLVALVAIPILLVILYYHRPEPTWVLIFAASLIVIIPGILATLIMWLAAGAGFGRYLAEYSFTYVNTYAGLASAMIALVFLYWTASIFVYGGELNAARLRFDLKAKQTEAV